MIPTIDEVKKVADECGAEMFGSPGRHISVIVSGHIIFTPEELQAFSQHFMNKRREIDAGICEELRGYNIGKVTADRFAEAIRNNTGE